MQSLIRSKSAGVTGGRGTAGAGPGRDLLYSAPILCTATLAVGYSPYLWSCEDEKRLGCATHPRLTIVLKTTNWPVTFLKMDWRPFR